jgi:hypothetical protein
MVSGSCSPTSRLGCAVLLRNYSQVWANTHCTSVNTTRWAVLTPLSRSIATTYCPSVNTTVELAFESFLADSGVTCGNDAVARAAAKVVILMGVFFHFCAERVNSALAFPL